MPTVSNELLACDRQGSLMTIYYNTGTCETPVWVRHEGVQGDLTWNETEDENEIPIRDPDQLVKLYGEGKIELSFSGEQAVDPAYEGFQIMNSCRAGGDAQDFMILTGPISEVGNIGWRGKMRNFDRTINGPQTGSMNRQFNLKPAPCTDCTIRPVEVTAEDTVADYDPTEFTPYGS